MIHTDLNKIPAYLRANYRVHTSWKFLKDTLSKYEEDYGVDYDPDFQRAHVWTEDKQIKYVEYVLANGPSAREIQWNSANWDDKGIAGKLELVDGKQRLTAALLFLDSKIPAYGTLLKDYKGKLDMCSHYFIFFINGLKTRKEVLQWYLQLNDGGVVHTKEEIEKVKSLLEKEI